LQGPQKLHALVNNAGANFMGIAPWWTEQGVAGLPQVRHSFSEFYHQVLSSQMQQQLQV